MNAYTVIAGIGLVAYVAATWTLVAFAWRTSQLLGLLCFVVPLYAISLGNHRIATRHAKRLALVGWVGFIVFLVTFVVMPR